MKLILIALILAGCTLGQGPRRSPSGETSRVLLISLDGFRTDYLERYPAPHLNRLAAEGGRAYSLQPIFPSATFPNHYSMVTGLYAEGHGVVGNDMYDPRDGARFSLRDPQAVNDPRWWGGEPFWITAERQGVGSGVLFWVGSTAPILGQRPQRVLAYDPKLTPRDRTTQVLNWLDLPLNERPRFLTLYFEAVDSAGHRYGPHSPQVAEAVAAVDGEIGFLLEALKEGDRGRGLNLVVVSDHGMAEVAPDRFISLEKLLGKETFPFAGYGAYFNLFVPDAEVERVHKKLRHVGMRTYRRSEIPADFRYGNHPRVGSLLVVAEEGWYLIPPGGTQGPKTTRGNHGYDPRLRSMHGIFLGWGPAFRKGARVPTFPNVDVYPLLAHLLGVEPAPNDGSLAALQPLLESERAQVAAY